MNPRVVAGQIAVGGPDVAGDHAVADGQTHPGAEGIPAVFFDHPQDQPMPASGHDVAQQVGLGVAIHDQHVDAAVVVDVAESGRATRGDQRLRRPPVRLERLEARGLAAHQQQVGLGIRVLRMHDGLAHDPPVGLVQVEPAVVVEVRP